MADITEDLQTIAFAVYGEEMRGSIYDAIYRINEETGLLTSAYQYMAPVGMMARFLGDPPAGAGWVRMDGSLLNISDHPQLAAHILETYGEVNYFGGNGVTTFAVPVMEDENDPIEGG